MRWRLGLSSVAMATDASGRNRRCVSLEHDIVDRARHNEARDGRPVQNPCLLLSRAGNRIPGATKGARSRTQVEIVNFHYLREATRWFITPRPPAFTLFMSFHIFSFERGRRISPDAKLARRKRAKEKQRTSFHLEKQRAFHATGAIRKQKIRSQLGAGIKGFSQHPVKIQRASILVLKFSKRADIIFWIRRRFADNVWAIRDVIAQKRKRQSTRRYDAMTLPLYPRLLLVF